MNLCQKIPFAKGHGTGNDFVILPDPDGELELSPALVAAVCDRRTGIGADGVLRVVRAAKDPESVSAAGAAEWFMDYRNSDGSLAQMCGNGARVFAHYLVSRGLVSSRSIPIATRDGIKEVAVHLNADSESVHSTRAPNGGMSNSGTATVNMGLPRLGVSTAVTLRKGGSDPRPFPAVAVDVGNPHAVCVVATPLAEFDLRTPPGLDAAVFPEGANVGLITPRGAGADGELRIDMRVHERGSGETLSCGTNVVAAALATLAGEPGTVAVSVPGGELRVVITETTSFLTGPSVIVAEGDWLL